MRLRLPSLQTGALVRSHENVTILFLDVCGFTSMAKQVSNWQTIREPQQACLEQALERVHLSMIGQAP